VDVPTFDEQVDVMVRPRLVPDKCVSSSPAVHPETDSRHREYVEKRHRISR